LSSRFVKWKMKLPTFNYKFSKMKNRNIFITLAIIAFGFSACTDHSGHTTVTPQTELNINYKAAFVVNGGNANLSVIDLSTSVAKDQITLAGTFPHHIYVSPNRSLLAVAMTGADLSAGHVGHATGTGFKIHIVDAVKGLTTKTLDLTLMPHNASFSPDGKELWVGQSDVTASKVLVYDATAWTVKNTITVGKGLSEVTFSTNGSLAFAANTSENTVSVIDAATKAVVKTLTVGATPVGAWAGTNGKMFVDNEVGKSISVIDVATKTIESTINLGFKPGYAAYNTKNAELWVSDADNGKVVFYKLENNAWVKKSDLATGADAHAIAFSADETTAFVTNQGAKTVSIINTAAKTKTKDVVVGDKPNGILVKD
jgi:YVTN family beta-propeller protein